MRFIHYVFVITVSFFISAGLLYIYDSYTRPRLKVVDIVSIMNRKIEELKPLEPASAQVEMEIFLKELNLELRKEEGIILIKNAVIGGNNYEDITEEIWQRVNKSQ